MLSIPLILYEDNKTLEFKPPSFFEFCEEVQRLFNIDNTDKLTYEYLTSDNKYHSLDVYNYPNFYMEDNIQKVFGYSSPDEANTYENQFYRCLTCKKNICPLCKSAHNKDHEFIDFEQYNFVCFTHNEKFSSYCKNCKINGM